MSWLGKNRKPYLRPGRLSVKFCSKNTGGFRRFYKPPEPGYPGFRYRSIREICSQKAVYFPNASGALPIPAAACKMIKSVYSAANGYAVQLPTDGKAKKGLSQKFISASSMVLPPLSKLQCKIALFQTLLKSVAVSKNISCIVAVPYCRSLPKKNKTVKK